MPVRYATPQEELAICMAWRARLLSELADVTEIIAGLEDATATGAVTQAAPLAHPRSHQ